jgi:hypothetical protein
MRRDTKALSNEKGFRGLSQQFGVVFLKECAECGGAAVNG